MIGIEMAGCNIIVPSDESEPGHRQGEDVLLELEARLRGKVPVPLSVVHPRDNTMDRGDTFILNRPV